MKNKRKVLQILSIFLSFIMTAPIVNVDALAEKEYNLEYCKHLDLGVRFLCSPDWNIRYEDNTILVVISKRPAIHMMIERTNRKVRFLSEVNFHVLQDLDRYQQGFGIEHIRMADREALFVKAFAKGNTDQRLSDYFLVNDNVLYNILFSIQPKEKRDDYKFIIKKIVDNFQFMDSSRGRK